MINGKGVLNPSNSPFSDIPNNKSGHNFSSIISSKSTAVNFYKYKSKQNSEILSMMILKGN